MIVASAFLKPWSRQQFMIYPLPNYYILLGPSEGSAMKGPRPCPKGSFTETGICTSLFGHCQDAYRTVDYSPHIKWSEYDEV